MKYRQVLPVCGAVQSGRRLLLATAGPGNVLMQEPFGMAEGMRLPLLAVIQQRGTIFRTVIYSQQEVTLTTFGGNGEGHRIVYSLLPTRKYLIMLSKDLTLLGSTDSHIYFR